MYSEKYAKRTQQKNIVVVVIVVILIIVIIIVITVNRSKIYRESLDNLSIICPCLLYTSPSPRDS